MVYNEAAEGFDGTTRKMKWPYL